MAVLSREEFYQQYDAAKQQGMDSNQAINYLAQAAVAAQPYNKQTASPSPQKIDTWQPGNRVPTRSEFNAERGITDTWQPPKTQQPTYDTNAALKNLQNIAATTTDKQLAKTITKYTSGNAKKDNFWGQTAASFGSGKINELYNQAAYRASTNPKDRNAQAVADAYKQLSEYYNTINAEALDEQNRKFGWLSKDMAQYAPQFIEQTKSGGLPTAIGAGLGLAAGLVIPTVGEEGATTAAGAAAANAVVKFLSGGLVGPMGGTIAGTKVGSLVGSAKYSYETMRGAAYMNLRDAAANNRLNISDEELVSAANDEAIVSSAIENLDNAMDYFALIPGIGNAAKKLSLEGVKALNTAIGKWATNVGQEGLEEFTQEIISIANERRAKSGDVDSGILGLIEECGHVVGEMMQNTEDGKMNLQQALEAAKGGAVIGGFMAPAGAAVHNVITGPVNDAILNGINNLDPNKQRAQQNRNYIAESNADSRARDEVSNYIRGTNALSNEESDARTKAYSEYAMQLDQAKRDDILVDGDGKLVGQVRGIAGNGFTLQTKGGSEAVFRSEASGSLDKNGAIYKALQSGGEFISEKEYAERQAQAEAQVAEAAETAPATPEMPTPEMATQEQLVQEAPAEMPSESPVSALENEGTSIADKAPESSTMQSDELVGQESATAKSKRADEGANVALKDKTKPDAKPKYGLIQDTKENDAKFPTTQESLDYYENNIEKWRKIWGQATQKRKISGRAHFLGNGLIYVVDSRTKFMGQPSIYDRNGNLLYKAENPTISVYGFLNDFVSKHPEYGSDISVKNAVNFFEDKNGNFDISDMNGNPTGEKLFTSSDQEHKAEIERTNKRESPARQRILTLDEYGNEDQNYELGGERFSPEEVARMTPDDVTYRLNSWAKRLGLKDMHGLSETLSTILNGNQGEDYAGSSVEKNQSKYAALQRGETVLPEIELIEDLSDEELDELFSLLDRAEDLDLIEEINGNPETTTPNGDTVERDFHGETAYGEQIKAIDEDIAEVEKELNQVYSQSRLDFQKFDIPNAIPEATRLEKRLKQLQNQKARLEEMNEKAEAENDRNVNRFDEDAEVLWDERQQELKGDERQERLSKNFYGGSIANNGPSFITADEMPSEHRKGSGGRVRGIKINGKTYYAVSSLEKGGYRNIMPDADVDAANNLIDQIKDFIDSHNKAAGYYALLEQQGKPIPKNFTATYRTVLHLKEVLDKIQNGGYTLQELWNDRAIPSDIIAVSPKNDDIRNRSIQAIANAVPETEAGEQILRMIGESNDLNRNTGRNGQAQGRVPQNNGQKQEIRTPKSREEIASIAQRYSESKRNAQERNASLGVQGQNTGTEEGRESLSKRLRAKAKRVAVNAAGKISNFVNGMKDAGYKVDTYKYRAADVAVAYDESTSRQLNRDVKSPAAKRILQKLNQRNDLDIVFADEFVDYDNGQVNFDNGIHVTKDGKSVIFAADIQTATHESAHEDIARIAPTFNSSEYWSPSDMVEDKTYTALKNSGVEVEPLKQRLIDGGYKSTEVGEEIFCELSACVETGLSSKFGPAFDEAANALRNSKDFRALMDDVYSQADSVSSSTTTAGNRSRDLSFSDDKEADIEDVMRMIEEDRKKPSLADYKASRNAMDAESRAETTREIEESFNEHRETNPEARKATQAERFGVKGDDNPLNLAKKVAEQSAKLKEKSVLNNDRKRAKMFGENKAAQRAKARFNGYMDILSKVANAEADVAELFTYANTLKDDPEMGVYVNEKVLNNLRKAAQLEEESAQTPTPDVVNAFKYQATKAMAMAAQQAENVDRVQSTIQSGLIEAALKYSKGNTNNVLVKGAQWLNRMQLNPGNFFRMIGGYDKGSRNTGYAMQQRVDRQNAVRITTEARLKDFFSGIKGDKQFRDFASGKTKSDVVIGDHKLSMLQAVQFKMLCDTLGIDDIRTSRLETLNGFALRDAGGNDTFIEMEGNTQAERYAWASQLYDQAVKSINENSAAKAYMKAAAKMFEDVKPDLVAVGEKVDGFPKAMYAEGKYLPLSYASKDGHPMDWTLTGDMSNGLSATRIMQERVRENGGYAVIRPISQTVDSYISQAANYIAYAELGNDLSIMGDANSLYGSLQNTIAKNFGDTYAQWLTNYTDDINQIKSVDPTGLNKVLAKARTMMQQGALLGSLSVPIKQISSYFSAMGVIDPRAVMKAYSPIRRSGNNIIDYLYKSRLQGSIDPDVSQALNSGWVEKLKNSGKLGAAVVNATNIMDSRTVANVYQACCYDVEMNSGLSMDEIYKDGDPKKGLTNAGELLVHSLFSEAVLNTQPIFNRQARAEIARTSSEALRMLSVFRTQQTQNYNRLLTTINEARAAKKFSGDTKSANREMRQTIGGQVAAAASISALTILADMLLHKHKKYKDDDEFDEEKILDRFALNFVEAGAGTALFTGDATKWLIDQIKGNTGDYASNKEFYGISMGAISSLKSAMNAWTWLYSDMLKGGKHAASDLRYAVNYTATLLGIPTQNAYNLMNSFYQYAGDMLGKDIISGYGSEKYEDIMKEWDAIRNDFGNKLYSAVRAGNTAKAKESVEQMGDKFLSMIKTSSMEQLKSGDADDDEVLNVLMTYGNRTAEEAADDVMKMHLQIDTGYTSLTGTGKQTVETAYADGKIDRAEFKKLYTKYSGKTPEQAEYSINRIDFKQKYPGNTYQDIKKMYMDGKLSKAEAAEWRYKTQENATKESAENWVKNLDFQKMTGYEANYTSTSDLYDTYESKEKLGVISFYDKYGSQFSSPKAFGDVFNYLNNNERTSYPTYKTSYGETSKNQSRVITLMNELIQQKKITYDMAKKIWSEHYGWSTGNKSAWVNVKG